MHKRPYPVQRRPNGFTMIELLVVMAVMGLVIAVATPRFHHALPGLEFRHAVHNLAAAMRQTRAAAIASGATQVLVLDLDDSLYQFPNGDPQALPQGLRFENLVDVTDIDRDERQVRYVFYPDGTSPGGRVLIETGQGTTPRSAVIEIDWLTGRVRVQEDADRV
ncbi:general secretion pathway protein GspH [Iodidimonas muriae]|uniref:Type II secretion system protein H n=1 Tax=Iodidimonas muriae TaxID=261467 RepID=A0ABQ2L7I0_9PROT|nr:GspH/FimT family pseudopilin [Iodidimonas muriae]GER06633.1 general secretion pathway protein GspH [Kordiimonadales bacterium JCM 17843]GGO05556.1 general secretion pathway protein GspH [Iodidimonas muriae]